MAEAAAVVGLVASIITLADLGTKIVSRIHDFTAQTTDVPQSLRSLADRLPLLIRTLQQVHARAQAGSVSNDVARDLKTLLDSLTVQIDLLEQCLRKVTPSTDASRLERTVKALQSLTKDERVTQAVDKVHRGIDVLVLHQTTTSVDLSERILQKLAELNLRQPATPQTLGLWLDRAPQVDPDAFLGRIVELRQLDDWLSPGGNTPSQRVVSITGMGGLGKTQLSLAYARRYGGQYSSVIWLNAQDRLSLQQGILTLSQFMFPDDQAEAVDARGEDRRVQRVRGWLSEPWNERWLIIFDNYDDPALPNMRSPTGFDLREFFPSRVHGSILITTRSPKLSFSRRLVLQKLEDIPLQVAILSQRAGRDLRYETGAERLATRLDGLPLALATAGTYIGQTGASCTEYLDVYAGLWNELHGPESDTLLEYADRTLSSTWTVSLDQVAQYDADAVQLLEFCALFNNEDIWYELLQAGASDGPAWMGRVTTTKLRFDRAITKLRDYSLVEVIPGSYRVHPCVHDWLLGRFQLAPKKSWFLAALICVTASIPDEASVWYWTDVRRLVRHVQRLHQKQFHHLWQAFSSTEFVHDAIRDFGDVYRHLDQFNEAEQMYIRALAGCEKVLGPDHSSTLFTVNSLGLLYYDQERLAEAEHMYLRALAGKEKVFGADHSSTLNTASNLGLLYYTQGKLAEAEQIYTRSLARYEKVLGPDNSSTLNMFNNLGLLYYTQGKLAEAERMCVRALFGKEKALGPDHGSTLNTVNNLGVLYDVQGNLAGAEQMYTRAIAGYEKTLGPDHTSALNTVNNLGRLYYNQGKLAEAEQMYTRALAGYERALGPYHTSTLTTLNNFCHLYRDHGKLAEAEQMYARALARKEKILGPDHSSTLTTLDNFCLLYCDHGKLAEAELVYRRAIARQEKTLGPDHCSTLRTVHNLGLLYDIQGNIAGAEPMYTRVLAGYEKAFGRDHASVQYILGRIHNLHNKSKLVGHAKPTRP